MGRDYRGDSGEGLWGGTLGRDNGGGTLGEGLW